MTEAEREALAALGQDLRALGQACAALAGRLEVMQVALAGIGERLERCLGPRRTGA